MDGYPLRNIPDDVWHKVKVRAATEQVTVRDVILRGLRLYAAGGLSDATEDVPVAQGRPVGRRTSTTKRRPAAAAARS